MLFRSSQVPKVAEEYGVPILGRLPVDPRLSALGDAGRVEEYRSAEADGLAVGLTRSLAAQKDRQIPML